MGGDLLQMARFFISSENIHNDVITITGNDVNHIKNVLRFKSGDRLEICDGSSNDYIVVIDSVEKDKINTKILDRIGNTNESDIEVTLFQGLPKSDKMDSIIQKNVELGIRAIYPVITDRTVVKPDQGAAAAKKLERWQRIAMEAAKQCRRGIIPRVENTLSFIEALEMSKRVSSTRIIPCLKEKNNKLRCLLTDKSIKSVSVFIGPEGGFSDEEVNMAEMNGIIPVTLGPRVLRTETAGFVVLSIIMHELGDLG